MEQEENSPMEVSEITEVCLYHNDGGDHTILSFYEKP